MSLGLDNELASQNDEEMFFKPGARKPAKTLELPLVIEDQHICIIWELGKILELL